MFDFLRKPGMRRPSRAVRRALATHDLPPGTNRSELGVVERRATYGGREVTLIRVFDPAQAVRRGVNVFTEQTYEDLNPHLDLVLSAGHIEQNGTVILDGPRHVSVKTARRPAPDPAVPNRAPADRSAHADDERYVFPDTDQARKAAARP
jgi:hypothetical protein